MLKWQAVRVYVVNLRCCALIDQRACIIASLDTALKDIRRKTDERGIDSCGHPLSKSRKCNAASAHRLLLPLVSDHFRQMDVMYD